MRAPSWRSAGTLGFAAICATACGTQTDDAPTSGSEVPTNAAAVPGSFTDYFRHVDTLRPEQSAEAPILVLSGFVPTPDGGYAIVEGGDAHVRQYGPDDALVRVIGGKGEGPGEFVSPGDIRVTPDGRLLILDRQASQLTTFTAEGEYLDRLRLPFRAMGFDLLPDGRVVATRHTSLGEAPDVIAALADDGTATATALPLGDGIPAGTEPHDWWNMLRTFRVATRDGRTYVTASLLDSLWIHDIESGSTETLPLDFPGYVPPRLDEEIFTGGLPAIREWFQRYHTAVKPVVTSQFLAVPFTMGVMNHGDPTVLVVVDRASGRRFALDATPPIAGLMGDGLVAIGNPNEEPLELSVWEYAPPAHDR